MICLVCLKEKAGGCDYTIGCGMIFRVIEANNHDEILEKIQEDYSLNLDEIETLMITEYSNMEVIIKTK